jgi:hypothetical protein
MALAEYIKDLERGVYGEKEGETLALSRGDASIPSEKIDSNFLAMLSTLFGGVSDREKKKQDEPISRREIDSSPPPKQQQQQGGGGGGGLSPLELWDLYNKYWGEGQTPQSTPSGEPAAATPTTAQPVAAKPVAAQPTTAAPATAPSGGGASFGSAGAVAAYIIAASLAQKQKDKEEKSKDPGRGAGSRKARIMAGLSPSLLEGIKDPKGEGLSQLTGIMPITSFLGMGSKGRGKTESEGTKIWDWLSKLF